MSVRKCSAEAMRTAWKRLKVWFADRLPSALVPMRSGASDTEISEFESATENRLPDDVREWFRLHDGQEATNFSTSGREESGILFGWRPLSLTESVEEWRKWTENTTDEFNEEIGAGKEVIPEGAIRPTAYLRGWIPLLKRQGAPDYVGLDFNPGPTGTVGQVINFGRYEETNVVIALCWADFINLIADAHEAGKVKYESFGEEGFEISGHLDFPQSRYSAELLVLTDVLVALHRQGRFDGTRLFFAEIS